MSLLQDKLSLGFNKIKIEGFCSVQTRTVVLFLHPIPFSLLFPITFSVPLFSGDFFFNLIKEIPAPSLSNFAQSRTI